MFLLDSELTHPTTDAEVLSSRIATLIDMRDRYAAAGVSEDILDQLDFYIRALTTWQQQLEVLSDSFQ